MMTAAKYTAGVGLSTFGLLLGFLCVGRAVETALAPDATRLNKRETMTVGLSVGIPVTLGALWLFIDLERGSQERLRQRQLAHSQRLQSLFYKVLKANSGRINPIQFAMLGEISLIEAQICLDAWAGPLNATSQVDETGVVMYCFDLSET
ncbi:hypothetical protein [Leptolyngbya sp. BC1307]|uniref:hypothetical protein n=1 Tax=Leptolyngbya sp. BC1307 TaxID=2029589 RepID=UPI000EFC294F|nr:hypothetical protein [Leptolyngbya sp. BC1307]